MKKIIIFILIILAFIFLYKILQPKPKAEPDKTHIQGIILPHHGLAKELLNTSFQKLKDQINPKIIVIYGTNHYFQVSETYTTTKDVKEEYNLGNVLADDSRIQGDHSIQTILPYISQYFPSSKVIPIIVSTQYSSVDGLNDDVKKFVASFGSKETLYIASVDFAHNVSLIEGLNKNKESIETISNFNYEKILGYSDDHMDSPVAITTLTMTMHELGATKWELWNSSHGALITNQLDLKGTSYVIGTFSN